MQADREQGAEDRWLRALAELPRPELDSARSAQISASLHSALTLDKPTLAKRWSALFERFVEPTLVVSCSGMVLVRLAMVLVRYLSNT